MRVQLTAVFFAPFGVWSRRKSDRQRTMVHNYQPRALLFIGGRRARTESWGSIRSWAVTRRCHRLINKSLQRQSKQYVITLSLALSLFRQNKSGCSVAGQLYNIAATLMHSVFAWWRRLYTESERERTRNWYKYVLPLDPRRVVNDESAHPKTRFLISN